MSAETLRRAASLIRERAEAATPGPWEFDADDMDPGVWSDAGSAGTWVVSEWATREANATHIASWHPAVALAVADWLDIMADPHAEGYRGPALKVARAYLGESA